MHLFIHIMYFKKWIFFSATLWERNTTPGLVFGLIRPCLLVYLGVFYNVTAGILDVLEENT